MEPRAKVRRLAGKQLLCTARNRALITDRRWRAAGTDIGYTSGELLLLAIGSCATGGLRAFFETKDCPRRTWSPRFFFEPAALGERDRIVIEIGLGEELLAGRRRCDQGGGDQRPGREPGQSSAR